MDRIHRSSDWGAAGKYSRTKVAVWDLFRAGLWLGWPLLPRVWPSCPPSPSSGPQWRPEDRGCQHIVDKVGKTGA